MKAPKPIQHLLSLLKSHYLILLFAIAALTLDQVTKNAVLAKMHPNQSIPLIEGIFHLTYVQNTGAAFSLFKDTNLIFLFLSLGILAGIFYVIAHVKPKGLWMHIAFGLLLGGAMGNILDRIFLGFVVDFLDFRIWPVFNVADCAISASLVLLIVLLWNK